MTFTALLRHWGSFGLFTIAILDSLPIPTFGGPDILTAILAARHREPWYVYAAVSTAGSVIGAYLTFRTARQAGSSYLQKAFGERRVSKLLASFQKWGTGGLVVSTAIPFPFPTSAFFAAAGALNYSRRTFLTVVALSRAARYSAIAAIADHYGRRFIRILRHPERYTDVLVLVVCVVILVVAAVFVVRRQLQEGRAHEAGVHETGEKS